jgi:stalled ribosome rescue protein Dom34
LKGPYEAHQVPADDSRQRALTGELNIYYDAVISALRDCESIILFGPGEAKGELHKRLKKAKLGARVLAVETSDKMTDPQILAKVRAHYAAAALRAQQAI